MIYLPYGAMNDSFDCNIKASYHTTTLTMNSALLVHQILIYESANTLWFRGEMVCVWGGGGGRGCNKLPWWVEFSGLLQ
jgi:hypothetical protein